MELHSGVEIVVGNLRTNARFADWKKKKELVNHLGTNKLIIVITQLSWYIKLQLFDTNFDVSWQLYFYLD